MSWGLIGSDCGRQRWRATFNQVRLHRFFSVNYLGLDFLDFLGLWDLERIDISGGLHSIGFWRRWCRGSAGKKIAMAVEHHSGHFFRSRQFDTSLFQDHVFGKGSFIFNILRSGVSLQMCRIVSLNANPNGNCVISDA